MRNPDKVEDLVDIIDDLNDPDTIKELKKFFSEL